MQWQILLDPFWVVIGSLATFRIASIIYGERIARPFRKLFGIIEDDIGERGIEVPLYPDTFFGHLLECFWCTSVWVAVIVALILMTPARPILVPLAFSSVAILIYKRVY